jgi:hypothetical protein
MVDERETESIPTGSALDDARLQFYLEHHELIRMWAALGDEVRAATNDLLVGLREDLEALALGIYPDAVVRGEALDSSYPRLNVMRRDWPLDAGSSLVAVAVEWTRKVDPAGSERPYYGVRVDQGKAQGKTIDAVLRPLTTADQDLRTAGLLRLQGQYWAARRYFDADANWWRDVPSWRQGMIATVAETFRLVAPLIDAALATDRPDL